MFLKDMFLRKKRVYETVKKHLRLDLTKYYETSRLKVESLFLTKTLCSTSMTYNESAAYRKYKNNQFLESQLSRGQIYS